MINTMLWTPIILQQHMGGEWVGGMLQMFQTFKISGFFLVV
jgi:hypothetical protein